MNQSIASSDSASMKALGQKAIDLLVEHTLASNSHLPLQVMPMHAGMKYPTTAPVQATSVFPFFGTLVENSKKRFRDSLGEIIREGDLVAIAKGWETKNEEDLERMTAAWKGTERHLGEIGKVVSFHDSSQWDGVSYVKVQFPKTFHYFWLETVVKVATHDQP